MNDERWLVKEEKIFEYMVGNLTVHDRATYLMNFTV